MEHKVMTLEPEELERIIRINNLTNDFHDKITELYEAWVDRDEEDFRQITKTLKEEFKSLNESYRQELK